MVAGVVLGPSLFGALAPGLARRALPQAVDDDPLRRRPARPRPVHVPGGRRVPDGPRPAAGVRAPCRSRSRASSCRSSSAALIALAVHADGTMFRRDGHRRARPSCTSAPPCRSPPSPCWRGSSTSAGSPGPRSARWRSPRARSTTRPRGACSRSSWRASASAPIDRRRGDRRRRPLHRSSCHARAPPGSSPRSARRVERSGAMSVPDAELRPHARDARRRGSRTGSASTRSSAPSCSAPPCLAGGSPTSFSGC